MFIREAVKNVNDTFQDNTPIPVILVYDADDSFSFVKELEPAYEKIRILIASTEGTAIFENDGAISFSHYFWKNILNGIDIRESFEYAENCVDQNPKMDVNGNGIFNEKDEDRDYVKGYTIGIGILLAGVEPIVTSVSPEQTLNCKTSAMIWAKTESIEPAEKVLALISSSEDPPGCCFC